MRYLMDIWSCRYFWLHLSRAELRARFRRSVLGILWALLQPLLMTLLLSFIFGSVFQIPMGDFAPFVFSGILVWEFICNCVNLGCASFIAAGPYICQRKLPLAIYPLKSVLTACVLFLVGMIGLFLWILLTKPGNLGWPLLSFLVSFPLLFLVGAPLAVVVAFINVKFRDFQFLVVLLLQALYFVSPVFLEPKMFRNAHIAYLLEYNPVYHILNLVRAPLLSGTFPGGIDYLFTLGTIGVILLVAGAKIAKEEASLIFYL
jgi:lipopolysaccharide transport system permease protein